MPDSESALTFRHFQEANKARCEDGFRHSVNGWNLLEWAGAAAGEMGEVANVCKKLRRQEQKIGGEWAAKDPASAALMGMLADEIGDTLAYLSLLAEAAGLDMGQCAARKFDRVSDKIKWGGPRLSALTPPSAPAAGLPTAGECARAARMCVEACDAAVFPPTCNVCGHLKSEGECRNLDCVTFGGQPSAPAQIVLACESHSVNSAAEREPAKCPKCGGAGGWWLNHSPHDQEWVPCPKCKPSAPEAQGKGGR